MKQEYGNDCIHLKIKISHYAKFSHSICKFMNLNRSLHFSLPSFLEKMPSIFLNLIQSVSAYTKEKIMKVAAIFVSAPMPNLASLQIWFLYGSRKPFCLRFEEDWIYGFRAQNSSYITASTFFPPYPCALCFPS